MHPRAREFTERTAEAHDFEVEVREFPEGTKTAADAAEAVGCSVAQIASSIVFEVDGELVVVVTSGANHVDESKLASLLEVDPADVSMADADRIKETLGWSIGGVPPFCHDSDVPVFVDSTLTDFEEVWAAAGTPKAVFPIDSQRLCDLADGRVAEIATDE